MQAGQRQFLLLAGVTDVLVAGALLALTVLNVVNLPLIVPILLMVAGLGIIVAVGISASRQIGASDSPDV